MVLVWIGVAALLLLGVYGYLRWVWFYRDPVRVPPQDPDALLSPVDGKVVYVRRVRSGAVESRKLGRPISIPEITWAAGTPDEGWLVGIYMSPLDVHYVYAPSRGRVRRLVHRPARVNWPMVDLWEYVRLTWLRRAVDLLGKRHHLENERVTVQLSTPAGEVWLVEIADRFVNKIRLLVEEGQEVAAGQKLSFISRGSQVDVILPDPDVQIQVRTGMQVYGALTVLARRRPVPEAAKTGAGATCR